MPLKALFRAFKLKRGKRQIMTDSRHSKPGDSLISLKEHPIELTNFKVLTH